MSMSAPVLGPYARAAGLYWTAGWHGALPLPVGRKASPPKGYTGSEHAMPSFADVTAWCQGSEGDGNIGIRLPRHVLGIDVDQYGTKRGHDEIEKLSDRLGALPPTWVTGSRLETGSGIALYTVPEGLAWPGEVAPAVEIIQYRHRYAVVWPSVHPEGRTYRWSMPDGSTALDAIPEVDALPALPPEWIEHLSGGAVETDYARDVDVVVWQWFLAHGGGVACRQMMNASVRYQRELGDSHVSRHDVAKRASMRITRMISEGHTGGTPALNAVRDAFLAATAEQGRDSGAEWQRMIEGAVHIAAAAVQTDIDPCEDPYAALTGHRNLGPNVALNVGVPLATGGEGHEGETATGHSGTVMDASTLSPIDVSRAQLLNLEVERQRAQRAARIVLDNEESASRSDPSALLIDGAQFILDAPDRLPIIWGNANEVAWAEGESLMLVGPPGVGKTTIAGQVIRARLGLGTGLVLSMSVTPSATKVLYLAMDRPAQAARALKRLFSEADRALLLDRLVIWRGPPPADVAKQTDTLLVLAQRAGADTIVIDSLKDAAIGLSEDDVAAGYNRARQAVLTAGIQVLELHHLVKRGANGGKPNTLADVYGSAWLSAGAGSVVLLWGEAGDPIVELVHLKQPGDPIGPLRVIHDHDTGLSSIWHSTDVLALARAAGSGGVTAKRVASAMFEADEPTASQVEKARRKLAKLTLDGFLTCREPAKTDVGIATNWAVTFPVTDDQLLGPSHGILEPTRNPSEPSHAASHASHDPLPVTFPTPPLKGGGPEPRDENDQDSDSDDDGTDVRAAVEPIPIKQAGGDEIAALIRACREHGGIPNWRGDDLIDSTTGEVLTTRRKP